MRVLLVSDLHANPFALEVLPAADAVLCAGDLVDYGPDPRAAIAWCRSRARTAVHGNHDRALAFGEDDGVGPAMREASATTRELHRAAIDDDDLAYLRSLPSIAVTRLGGVTFAITHGVAGNPRRYAPLVEAAASVRAAVRHADVVVLGHTHIQEAATFDGYVAVNPGSAGMASTGGEVHYALWTDGEIELLSVPYDVTAALRAVDALQLPATAHSVLARAFRVGRMTTPR